MGHRIVSIVLLVWTVTGPSDSVRAANLFTINDTAQDGVSGGLLATPPGTCTGVPGGLPGNCSLRGSAAIIDWAEGYFANGSRWSDATQATLPSGTNLIQVDGTVVPVTSANLPGLVNTNIGTSWIPASCNRPWCGMLLRGDVISHLDENGDGVFDDTWNDLNFDGIRDAGEVDRTRAEQFAWGMTSVIRDLSDLSLVRGNVSPPGISRMRTRIALGDAALAPDGGCDGDIMNPSCHNALVTSPDLTATTASKIDDDAAIFGKCDPDRPEFTSLIAISPVRAQKALDNCLWYFASFPIGTPSPGSFDSLHNQLDPRLRPEGLDPLTDPFAIRKTWIDERVVKYVEANSLDQNFSQSWMVTYGFISPPGAPNLDQGVYRNQWRLAQSDTGPKTYDYLFLIRHMSEARRRGFTQDPTTPVDECVPALPGVTCDGLTNPTVDPFWGKAIVRTAFDLNGDGILDPALNPDGSIQLNFDQEFEFVDGKPCGEACRESGVGHETDIAFLYEQWVEGYLLSCLNCGHPAVIPAESLTFDVLWPEFPSVSPVPHPPLTMALPVLP
jgi:hypothetical protein